MVEFSLWDEPMLMLDALAIDALKASPFMAQQVADIQRLLKAIRAESEQQQHDLDQIFAVLESIEGRNYSKAQEAIRDCDF